MKFKDMPKLPLVLAGVMFAVGALLYAHLPVRIPMHWGPSGQIDGWGTKSLLTVFFAPAMTLIVYVTLWFAPYLDPQRRNLIRSKQVYAIALELLAGMMTVVFFGQMYASYRHDLPMTSVIFIANGVTMVVLGNYMGRVKRNWTMGVRYSWTLSDDVVWAKTNRLGGWLFVGAGLLSFVAAFLPPLVGIWLVVVPIFAVLGVTYFYAMGLYKQRHPDEVGRPVPLKLAEQDEGELGDVPVLHAGDPTVTHVETTCPACGADNAPGNIECIRCGKRLPKT